jgi:hypothetical protein
MRRVAEVLPEHVIDVPGWDVSIIRGPTVERVMPISAMRDAVATGAHIRGWVSESGDCTIDLTKDGPEPGQMRSTDALQIIKLADCQQKVVDLSAADLALHQKPCWCGAGTGRPGASGGPCFDQQGGVIGVAVFGTPADQPVRDYFGAVDVRCLISENQSLFAEDPELQWIWRR